MLKLVDMLARAGSERLTPLLGEATIALVVSVAPAANNPKGLAEIVIAQYSAAGSLATAGVREIVFDVMRRDEAEDLCRMIDLPVGDPINTLKDVPFDYDKTAAERLRAFFLVDYEDTRISIPPEVSRRIKPTHPMQDHQLQAFRQLRRRIDDRSAAVLVDMPVGAGKLRIAATAVADLFRSAPDGELIVWLAYGERLCESAFDEVCDRWREIGTRDVTAYRLYGIDPLPDLSQLNNGFAVIDVSKLSAKALDQPGELRALGARTRVVILSDAADVSVHATTISLMREGGLFSLVGLRSTPDRLKAGGTAAGILRAYHRPHVHLEDEDPCAALRRQGWIVPLESGTFASKADVGSTDADAHARDAETERAVRIVRALVAEVSVGRKVVFYADSAQQARMFTGILSLKAASASAVVGSMPPEQRSQEIARFDSRGAAKVLCVHDVLVSGSAVPNATAAVVAARDLPAAVYAAMIGRLCTGRGCGAPPLRVVAADDLADLPEIVGHVGAWRKLEPEQ